MSAARAAASGRRAGQMWSVEMWPCRTFFSCTESSETCFSGKATSMRRLSLVGMGKLNYAKKFVLDFADHALSLGGKCFQMIS